jgi:hypothetical protein
MVVVPLHPVAPEIPATITVFPTNNPFPDGIVILHCPGFVVPVTAPATVKEFA